MSSIKNGNLLEQYFYGKDNNLPSVIEEIFAEDSRVTFTIQTNVIDFPTELRGSKDISNHMFASFHDEFEQVKSYYIVHSLEQQALLLRDPKISRLNWLVTMRERQSGLLRVGTGHYDWVLASNDDRPQIESLHVLIKTMKVFEEPESGWLDTVQSELANSWVLYDEVINVCSTSDELLDISEYSSTAANTELVA